MAKKQGKVAQSKSDIIREIPMACADEDAAVEFMESRRWGDMPRCACCDSTNVYQQMNRDKTEREANYRWRCRDCKKQYTVRKGTVFEDSRIPLRHWCFAFWAACSSKKGVSAKQIQRQTGLSYKSALFLMHRIRHAMAPTPEPDPKLDGIVEVDETYVGGKPRKKGWKDPKNRRNNWSNKIRVVGMVQRGGDIRAEVAASITTKNLRDVVMENVDTTARLITDEYVGYRNIGKQFQSHETVAHTKGEYARGDVTTNTIEGFFGLLKRKLYGTHHAVSKAHLNRYVYEAAFIYNHRNMDDGARTEAAIRRAVGRRLTYSEPVKRAS